MAKTLNEREISVCFLPELEDVSSADALIKIGKRWAIADFKYSKTTNSNTLGENLRKGFDQASVIILKMASGDAGTLAQALEQAKRKGQVKSLIVIGKYNHIADITKRDIQEGKYKKKIRGKI